MSKQKLSAPQREELLNTLQQRFEKNRHRHEAIFWPAVNERLTRHPDKLWSLAEMEISGGEPDVIEQDLQTGEFVFYDCAAESPKGRRSFCYDLKAWESRKENKPQNNALDVAATMGIELLTEAQYKHLQELGNFDLKTSSWIKTPDEIRSLGGAIFCDKRYNKVFTYHNGAESYYAARGFRGLVKI